MPKLVPGRHGGTMNQFLPGESGNPAGRPRKYVSTLRGIGYKLTEINDAIQNLIAMTHEELKVVSEDKKATILEQIVARSLIDSYNKKNLINIETLITRVYGRPADQKPLTDEQQDDYANLTSEQIAERFKKIIDKSKKTLSDES